jgi:serine/threonine-protein phosphatase 5
MLSRLYEFHRNTRRIIVVGDLHGSLPACEAAIRYWRAQNESFLIFLGDYADRGPGGAEIIASLGPLAAEPRVVLLKGNHEDYSPAGEPLFQPADFVEEVEAKRGDWPDYFQRIFQPFLAKLHLAALLPGEFLFVHGGVSSRITSVESLRHPSSAQEEDLLWSDPIDGPGERPSSRGKGVEFGPDITRSVLAGIGIRQIIRSHQPYLAPDGPHYSHDRSVITLSSTGVYGGRPFFLDLENRGDGFRSEVHFA